MAPSTLTLFAFSVFCIVAILPFSNVFFVIYAFAVAVAIPVAVATCRGVYINNINIPGAAIVRAR